MKTVSGKVITTIPISLSNAAKTLSEFAASDHCASHAVSLYLQRASDSFNQLVQLHHKLGTNKEHASTDDVKIEGISENRRLKTEDIPNGFGETRKSKNLAKEETPDADARKRIKSSSKVDIVKEQKLTMADDKNEDTAIGFKENKKSRTLGKEETPDSDKRKRIKSSSKVDKVKEQELTMADDTVKNEDTANGFRENKKSKSLGKEETPDADKRERIKSSSKIDIVKEQNLIMTEQFHVGETEKSKIDNSVKLEHGFEEVKEDCKDKKKKKKKRRSVGDSEVHDAGENAGSAEQSSKKKKSKKRRSIEGEK